MDKYRRGVSKGIEIARNSSSGKCSKTDGLRVIRRFEEVNKCPYDQESLSHTYLSGVSGVRVSPVAPIIWDTHNFYHKKEFYHG